MDADIFSKAIYSLILRHDVVKVPELGYFIAQKMGAAFSDRGSIINPPYRKLSFRSNAQLPSAVMQHNMADEEAFFRQLKEIAPFENDVKSDYQQFIESFKAELNRRRNVRLGDLGTMRATAQRDYFFIADDDLDIYPEGFGLMPISIKNREEARPQAAVDAAVGAEPAAESAEALHDAEPDEAAAADYEPLELEVEEPAVGQSIADEIMEEAKERPITVTIDPFGELAGTAAQQQGGATESYLSRSFEDRLAASHIWRPEPQHVKVEEGSSAAESGTPASEAAALEHTAPKHTAPEDHASERNASAPATPERGIPEGNAKDSHEEESHTPELQDDRLPAEDLQPGDHPADEHPAPERHASNAGLITLAVIIILVALLMAVLYLYKDADWLNAIIDKLLYTQEELDLIHGQ